jgi:hypothetical protein
LFEAIEREQENRGTLWFSIEFIQIKKGLQ